jgi:hypothetical protein
MRISVSAPEARRTAIFARDGVFPDGPPALRKVRAARGNDRTGQRLPSQVRAKAALFVFPRPVSFAGLIR